MEGEALAVADALDRARHFVLGCRDLTIAVDHKPLLKLFGDRCLEDIPNPRLRNIKEKTLRYRFRMVYIPGTRNLTSDALSRHPSGTRAPTRLHLPDDLPAPSPKLLHPCPRRRRWPRHSHVRSHLYNPHQLGTAPDSNHGRPVPPGPNAGHRGRTTHQTQLAPSGDTGLLPRDNRPHPTLLKTGCEGNTPTKVFQLHWCYRYTPGVYS